MYSISYNISYMQCSAFFFHSTRETLLNREDESEWLIHKWDPDSVIGDADTTVSSLAKVANIILLSAFKKQISIGSRLHDTAPAKMHTEGAGGTLAWRPLSIE